MIMSVIVAIIIIITIITIITIIVIVAIIIIDIMICTRTSELCELKSPAVSQCSGCSLQVSSCDVDGDGDDDGNNDGDGDGDDDTEMMLRLFPLQGIPGSREQALFSTAGFFFFLLNIRSSTLFDGFHSTPPTG